MAKVILAWIVGVAMGAIGMWAYILIHVSAGV